MFAVGRGCRLGALEIGTEPRSNLRFEFAGGKVSEGESFCIFLLWYCVITCVYGWRAVFRRNTVGVSLLKKVSPMKRRTCVEFFAAVKLYYGTGEMACQRC